MIRWLLAALAALGLIGSKATVAPSNGPAKSANPSATSPTASPQDTRTDGQPLPPP